MSEKSSPHELDRFWNTIGKVQEALDLEDGGFSDFIGISEKDYVKSKRKKILPLSHLLELGGRLGIDYESFFSDNFRVDSIINSHTARNLLSERYSIAAYSRTAPVINILNYLEETRGIKAKVDIFKRFNLPPNFFLDDEQRTNILLISDITQYLKFSYGMKDEEFVSMGRRTPFTVKNPQFEAMLTGKRDVQEVMASFFEECTHYFDKNYTYGLLKLEKDYAIIDAAPKLNVLEELKMSPAEFGNEAACLTRMGVISSVTWYQFKRFSTVTKISSIYHNDSSNRYFINLSPFN